MFRYAPVLFAAMSLLAWPSAAAAEPDDGPFSAGGYLRIMARPDLQGGMGRLGFWNLYGRLLNEGPYAALELRLDLMEQDPVSPTPWTALHAKVEGGSVRNADSGGGSLGNFALTQLYAQTGNVVFENVTWQIGTLESYWGDLGLYDFRPAQILERTVGLSSRYRSGGLEFLVGVGDSGFAMRGLRYNTVLTAGSSVKVDFGDHAQVGVGGEYRYEPSIEGNQFAPHVSRFEDPDYGDDGRIGYENFVRGEVVETFFEEGGRTTDFADPRPVDATSFKLIGHVGFGNLGPLLWNNLFANFLRRHPDNFVFETYEGEEFRIYVTDLTDERFELNVGNEMQLRLVPGLLDLTWALFYGFHYDNDNFIEPDDHNRQIASLVGRFQVYLTDTLHFLLESSVAQERSLNGNRYRNHEDSIFEGTDGRDDARGLEFGDSDTRQTFQLKTGPVLNPMGPGVFSRPSFRLLYGAQYSTQNNAFSNSFVDSLDEFDDFGTVEQHWHHIIALEVETWF